MYRNNIKSNTSLIKSKSGFAVLFAILLASFLITLGISIFSISLKEIMIITGVRDSQIAYYVADSARECAVYWDVKQGAFPACLDSGCLEVSTSTTPIIKCNGRSVQLNFIKKDLLTYYSGIPTVDFFMSSTSVVMAAPVSDIRLTKEYIASNPPVIKTTIDTWGHNTRVLGRRVERGIKQVYNQ